MKNALANLSSVVLVLCALTVTGLVLRNEWTRSNPPPAQAPAELPPVKIDGWEDVATGGSAITEPGAPVTLVEYSDFQCPFCATVVPTLRNLEKRYGDRLTVVFRHYPLESIHPFAKSAAMAAECAGEQGRFRAYHDALFAGQESIGTAPWGRIASSVGVADRGRFDACVQEGRFAARIAKDQRSGIRIGVKGTPTIIINGMMLRSAPTEEALTKQIDQALGGREPATR